MINVLSGAAGTEIKKPYYMFHCECGIAFESDGYINIVEEHGDDTILVGLGEDCPHCLTFCVRILTHADND